MRRTRLAIIITAVATATATLAASPPATAVGDRDCGDFASQRAAQIFFLKHGGPQSDPHGLDSDSDGVACESNPAPYYYGTSLPDSDPAPQPQPQVVKTSVDLALSRATAISGEQVRLTASVSPRGVRSVAFQRRTAQGWKTFDRDRSNRRGKAVIGLRAPRGDARYRAVVAAKKAGNKTFTSATSNDRSLRIQKQHLDLALSRNSVAELGTVRAVVEATPARAGRSVSLQERRDGRWETVATERQDSRGRATFSVPSDVVGEHTYRAIAHDHRGASQVASASVPLTVMDVTAPPAPVGLVATPGIGSVDLTWATVPDDDLSHYLVSMRPAPGLPWVPVGQTSSTSMLVDDLTGEVLQWFAVRAVDGSGNVSSYSDEVSATALGVVLPLP